MGMIDGLKGLKEFREQREAASTRQEREKVDYVKWPEGNTVTITGRFLNELDPSSPNYSEKNGTAHIVLEHIGPGPQGFKRRAECTYDADPDEPFEKGLCFVHDKRKQANDEKTDDWKLWNKPSPRAYLNFAYKNEAGEEVVGVYACPTEGQNIFETLLQYAEEGGITDREFKITRKKVNGKTTYTAMGLEKKKFEKSVEDYELQNLEAAHLKMPYDNQVRFYNSTPGYTPSAADLPEKSGSEGSEGGGFNPSSESSAAGWKSW